MASLKEIRNRITSVSSTMQITSAMKMVSAAKLRKAQDAITRMRPYANKLHETLTHLSADVSVAEDNAYAQNRDVKRVLVIAISSNKGLCGAFNTNVAKQTIHIIEERYARQYKTNNVDIVAVGKKAAEVLKARGYMVHSNHNYLYDDLTFDNVSKYTETVMKQFVDKKYDRIELVYNRFKNAATQELTDEQFLPVEVEADAHGPQHDYIFEPSQSYIVETLIPKSLKIQLFKALLDSNAAEHGARMTAMHKATDNADSMIKDLKLHYNKARQTSITNEILEIVGGAEALAK